MLDSKKQAELDQASALLALWKGLYDGLIKEGFTELLRGLCGGKKC